MKMITGRLPGEPAAVGMLLPNTSPEESLAAVTRGRAVVLARGAVPADGAVLGEHARTLDMMHSA